MKKRRVKLLKGEKRMWTLLILLIVSIPFIQVFSSSLLNKSSIDLEKIERQIEKQTSKNESISMQVNELASLANIKDIANEYGLTYNNSNIKVLKGE